MFKTFFYISVTANDFLLLQSQLLLPGLSMLFWESRIFAGGSCSTTFQQCSAPLSRDVTDVAFTESEPEQDAEGPSHCTTVE